MAGDRAQVPSMVPLLAFVCALVLVDTVFFSALTPLLPHYTRTAGLTKAGAGLLVACYPAGTLVGSPRARAVGGARAGGGRGPRAGPPGVRAAGAGGGGRGGGGVGVGESP